MWTQLMRYDPLVKLNSSKFRRKFQLSALDKKMFYDLGEYKIREHAEKIIRSKLIAPTNNEKITPYRGHPVFVAQHATATCCRTCLQRWHRIPKYKHLNEREVSAVVNLIVRWIRKKSSSSRDDYRFA